MLFLSTSNFKNNNLITSYIFDAELNQHILTKFLDLKDSVKVISLKSFLAADRRINIRTSQSFGAILKSEEYYFPKDSVSWMAEGGKYFISTIDRSDLVNFLNK